MVLGQENSGASVIAPGHLVCPRRCFHSLVADRAPKGLLALGSGSVVSPSLQMRRLRHTCPKALRWEGAAPDLNPGSLLLGPRRVIVYPRTRKRVLGWV